MREFFLMRLCPSPRRYGIIADHQTVLGFGHRTLRKCFEKVDPRVFETKKGIKISLEEKELADLKKQEETFLLEEMFNYLASGEKSKRHLRDWLSKRFVDKEKIKQLTDLAYEKKFISNDRFARYFTEIKKQSASMPWWMTKKQLNMHGVEGEITSEFSYDDEKVLYDFYEKKTFQSIHQLVKLKNRLIGRGFPVDVVKKLIEHLKQKSNL